MVCSCGSHFDVCSYMLFAISLIKGRKRRTWEVKMSDIKKISMLSLGELIYWIRMLVVE